MTDLNSNLLPVRQKFNQNNQAYIRNKIKISVLGKGMVGKSSLCYSFINYDSPEFHDPTIEDKYKVQKLIKNENCGIG